MKKILYFISLVLTAFLVTSCGEYESAQEYSESESVSDETSEDNQEIPTYENDEEIPTYDEENKTDDEYTFQTCRKTIQNSEKPEVSRIMFLAECKGNIKKSASVKDLYNVDYLHSGVVGLVGVPVRLEYNENIHNPSLTFFYNKDELRGIPEKNLIVLHYLEDEDFYEVLNDSELDTANCTITFSPYENGVYMLCDAFQWYSIWGTPDGSDISDYAYEISVSDYVTDWEREWDTGSIMELADKEWAKENSPYFRVSTPEQLASAVYWINGTDNYEYFEIVLENDIDLSGYDWKPIGWYSGGHINGFTGHIDGQGHTINGMKISVGYEDCGFIGYGNSVEMENISFTNAEVNGTACTGIAGGEIYGTSVWENVSVSGTVNGGGDDYGAIVGRETSITFENCTADVMVKGEPFEYLSYRQKIINETEIVETFNITLNDDYTVTRDEHEGFHNLGWHIERDGIQLLERLAENETVLDTHKWVGNSSGKYTIYLVAYINGTYIRVSNIIEYELN